MAGRKEKEEEEQQQQSQKKKKKKEMKNEFRTHIINNVNCF